jgi:hypothetical protein
MLLIELVGLQNSLVKTEECIRMKKRDIPVNGIVFLKKNSKL